MKSLKIGLIGYGKMGKMIEKLAPTRGHSIETIIKRNEFPNLEKCSVCIDFTEPNAVLKNIQNAAQQGKNIVVGTTGWNHHLSEVKELAEKYQIGILFSPNFSIGVYIFLKIVEEAAKQLSKYETYDVAGYEIHHTQKLDSPSGTAKAIQSAIDKHWPHSMKEFSSIRVGQVMGLHSVKFDSIIDQITLTHEAKTREGFALGSILGAEWLEGKKGFYTMEDMFL